jgi:tetratricopeptide (TPR) repeat protein/CHAT domain-containing protein
MLHRVSIPAIALLLLFSHCEMRDRPLADATDLFDRAVSLYDDRAYPRAESLFVQALSVFERAGQAYNVVETNRYLGQLYLAEGRYFTALVRFDSALQQSEALKDFRSEITLHALMGDTYVSLARGQAAMASYREAHRLSSAFNDLETKASLEMRMARSSMFSDHLDDAFFYYQSAFSYYQGQKGAGLAEALRGLGEVLLQQKKFDAAQTSLVQARSLLPKNDQLVLDAQLRLDLGLVQKALGNQNDALQWFRDAVNLLRSRKSGKDQEILLLFHIGQVYLENGRPADAKKYFVEAEALARAGGDGIAEAYLDLFGVRCDERGLSQNQRIQEMPRLIQAYRGVVEKFQAVGHRSGEAYAHAQLGRLYESVGTLTKARDEYREAIEVEEAAFGEYLNLDLHFVYLTALQLEKERLGWYAQLAGLLVQMKAREEALGVIEAGAMRPVNKILQEVTLGARHPNLKQDLLKARTSLGELRMLQTEQSSILGIRRGMSFEGLINSLHGRIQSKQREFTTLAARIAGLHPNYEPLLRWNSVKLKEIQPNIPPGSLVIRFLPTADQLHVFVISRNKFELKSTIVPREKLLSLVQEYMRLLNDPSVYTGSAGETSVTTMTRFAALSTQLYDYLLRPIDSMLERNLIIVASPEFDQFPFHTLERQERGGSVKYLIEISSVDYVPSLSSIRFKTVGTERINRVVGVGNPTGKNWSIDYELRDIRSFFKEAAILIGKEASWDNLTEARADALQLSTDFLMGEGESPLGVMALAKPQAPDEVAKVPFERLTDLDPPSLVVLSNQYGQGVGLSTLHALLLRLNGTSDVFLNAWFSDRKASKFFSEFFYTHLANGLAPGDAYRQALLNLIRTRDLNHPHSWGQFFHFGLG